MGYLVNYDEAIVWSKQQKLDMKGSENNLYSGDFGENHTIYNMLPGPVKKATPDEDKKLGIDLWWLLPAIPMSVQVKNYSSSFLFTIQTNGMIQVKHEWNTDRHVDLVSQMHKFFVTDEWIMEPKLMTMLEYRTQYIKQDMVDEFLEKLNNSMKNKLFVGNVSNPLPFVERTFGQYLKPGISLKTMTKRDKPGINIILAIDSLDNKYQAMLDSRKK